MSALEMLLELGEERAPKAGTPDCKDCGASCSFAPGEKAWGKVTFPVQSYGEWIALCGRCYLKRGLAEDSVR